MIIYLTPVKNEELSLEGSKVTLSYNYSKTADLNDYFFWYRQYPGKPPEYLLMITGLNIKKEAESLKSDPRISTKLSEDKRGVDLEISSAAVTDSALYYCPTVTGNTQSLYRKTRELAALHFTLCSSISSAAVTHSALYYCAVQPTVTGNTQSLYKNLTANSRSCTTLQTQSPRRHFLVLSTHFKMHSFRILV
uniref:Immunoglobulin V-set domain-containing protein n=1 Tax=Myripristis murdjan TaxID=586833 RepID=A0A667WLJ8_9TELE